MTTRSDTDAGAAPDSPMNRNAGRKALALAVASTVLTNLPIFLLGALVAEMSAQVEIPTAGLGIAVGAYWVFSAISSIAVGSIGQKIPSQILAVLSIALAIVSLLGDALALPTWHWMVVWAAVGGVANGFGHPASNDLIAARVPDKRRGFAFGAKQAAVPLAGMAAGISLPLIALTAGWQLAFILAAGVGVVLLVAFVIEARVVAKARRAKPVFVPLSRELRRYLLVVATVTTLSATAINATSVFAVTGAVDRGFDPALAGLLLSGGSFLAAATRIVLGVAADRGIGGTINSVQWILLVATVGLVLMAFPADWSYVVGFLLAVGIGWGWPGVTHYVVARVSGPSITAGTGIVQTGSYIGSAVGPTILGFSLQHWGSSVPWLILAAIALLAAIMAAVASRIQPPIPR